MRHCSPEGIDVKAPFPEVPLVACNYLAVRHVLPKRRDSKVPMNGTPVLPLVLVLYVFQIELEYLFSVEKMKLGDENQADFFILQVIL